MFFGRKSQLEKIADAINERGQHVILYGERGVGTTSLANIMARSYTNLYVVKVTCDRSDTFKTLWQRAFQSIQFSKDTDGIGFKPEKVTEIVNLEAQISTVPNLRPNQLVNIINALGNVRLLFIFDEFDNIKNEKTQAAFADLIKSMSDNNRNSTIVLVGIADNVEDLIGEHQSLERCLKQVKMPRMRKDECEEIILNGFNKLELTIENSVKDKIIDFSSGFPHYIHLLCKYGCQELIENEKTNFIPAYLTIAIRQGIENTSEQLRSSFRKAILTSNNSNKWRDLIYSCAISKIDEFNSFTITEVVKNYNSITGETNKNNKS